MEIEKFGIWQFRIWKLVISKLKFEIRHLKIYFDNKAVLCLESTIWMVGLPAGLDGLEMQPP